MVSLSLEDGLREILNAIEVRKKDRQKQARLALLEHLLEGQPPIEVAPGFSFCCGLTTDGRAWCSQNSYALPAE